MTGNSGEAIAGSASLKRFRGRSFDLSDSDNRLRDTLGLRSILDGDLNFDEAMRDVHDPDVDDGEGDGDGDGDGTEDRGVAILVQTDDKDEGDGMDQAPLSKDSQSPEETRNRLIEKMDSLLTSPSEVHFLFDSGLLLAF